MLDTMASSQPVKDSKSMKSGPSLRSPMDVKEFWEPLIFSTIPNKDNHVPGECEKKYVNHSDDSDNNDDVTRDYEQGNATCLDQSKEHSPENISVGQVGDNDDNDVFLDDVEAKEAPTGDIPSMYITPPGGLRSVQRKLTTKQRETWTFTMGRRLQESLTHSSDTSMTSEYDTYDLSDKRLSAESSTESAERDSGLHMDIAERLGFDSDDACLDEGARLDGKHMHIERDSGLDFTAGSPAESPKVDDCLEHVTATKVLPDEVSEKQLFPDPSGDVDAISTTGTPLQLLPEKVITTAKPVPKKRTSLEKCGTQTQDETTSRDSKLHGDAYLSQGRLHSSECESLTTEDPSMTDQHLPSVTRADDSSSDSDVPDYVNVARLSRASRDEGCA